MKVQKRIKGVRRIPIHPSVIPQIQKIVETTANKFDVSKSFVVATALADYFGVKAQTDKYYDND